MSRDPAFAGRNWFAYCDNNPLNSVDPSGLDNTVLDGFGDSYRSAVDGAGEMRGEILWGTINPLHRVRSVMKLASGIIQVPSRIGDAIGRLAFDVDDDKHAGGELLFEAVVYLLTFGTCKGVGAVARGGFKAGPPSAVGLAGFDAEAAQAAAKVPAEWGPGVPTAKGGGTRWQDPSSKGNGVRVDPASPNSPFPSQQVSHVIIRRGGTIRGRDGKPINGRLSDDPLNGHIPLGEWLDWTDWWGP